LGGKSARPYALFLLTLGEDFSRVSEKKDFYSFWTSVETPKSKVEETLAMLVSEVGKKAKPFAKSDFYASFASQKGFSQNILSSYFEVSKLIQENRDNEIGLADWPEIKPRGVKDKAYLVFKKHGKPLHFTDVATLIDTLEYNQPNKKTYPQTVHNELIKDNRFVLVGRGTYALSEWGYFPGTIKDIIVKVLSDKKEALNKDEIVEKVLAQRLVAKNTVLMNLNNKSYFQKDLEGRYLLKKVQSA
jgi:hypothetical protein